jgi:prepilin-type N-terminal cleavage/methylation domain-containing protein
MTARAASRSGFTLIELLVAMGIIAVLGTITIVAIRAVSSDAKLATGLNTVMAALDQTRAEAIKRNRIMLVVFRPVQVSAQKQAVEIVLAESAGDSWQDGIGGPIYDRFLPVLDVQPRRLPAGLKVAGPYYRDPVEGSGTPGDGVLCGEAVDGLWVTQTHLPAAPAEAGGELIGVMYAPDGTTITRNARSDSSGVWVDLHLPGDPGYGTPQATDRWEWIDPLDETLVNVVPFLAVYDDDDARESYDPAAWTNICTRTIDLSDYINQFADRVHFNRYTGVAMR